MAKLIRKVLPLVAGLALWAGQSQAAPIRSLAPLAARLQGTPATSGNKSLASRLAVRPALSTLVLSSESRIKQTDPETMQVVSRLAFPRGRRNPLSRQFKNLASRLGRDNSQSAGKRSFRAVLGNSTSNLPPLTTQLTTDRGGKILPSL